MTGTQIRSSPFLLQGRHFKIVGRHGCMRCRPRFLLHWQATIVLCDLRASLAIVGLARLGMELHHVRAGWRPSLGPLPSVPHAGHGFAMAWGKCGRRQGLCLHLHPLLAEGCKWRGDLEFFSMHSHLLVARSREEAKDTIYKNSIGRNEIVVHGAEDGDRTCFVWFFCAHNLFYTLPQSQNAALFVEAPICCQLMFHQTSLCTCGQYLHQATR